MEAAADRAGVHRHPAHHPAQPAHPAHARRDGPARAGGADPRPAREGRRATQALADRLAERREALFEEAGRFVERQHELYASETGRRMREDLLARQKLTAIEPEDMRHHGGAGAAHGQAPGHAVQPRKRHRADKGKLDVRKTIRKSMGYGGVPFDIVWKTETIEKPKIVAICDVSRSVAAAAQFLLLFLYSLNEVVEKLEAFAFSDRLVRVGDILEAEELDVGHRQHHQADRHAPHRLRPRPGGLLRAAPRRLDRHTTVIILGDGRSNYVEPAARPHARDRAPGAGGDLAEPGARDLLGPGRFADGPATSASAPWRRPATR